MTPDDIIQIRDSLLGRALIPREQDLIRDCEIALGVYRCTSEATAEAMARVAQAHANRELARQADIDAAALIATARERYEFSRIHGYGVDRGTLREIADRLEVATASHRALLARLAVVLDKMDYDIDPDISRRWGAEIRSAITGRKYLYHCPEHGDRTPIAQRHAHASCDEEGRIDGRWFRCALRLELIGEVEMP